MEMLLNHRAGANIANRWGHAPLQTCALIGDIEGAQLLLRHRAVVDRIGNLQDSPLLMAACLNRTDIVEALCTARASVTARQTSPSTAAAHYGAFHGNQELMLFWSVLQDRLRGEIDKV